MNEATGNNGECRITVVGPGAIGGLVAARLSLNPKNAITLAARSPLDMLVLETADGKLHARARVLTDPAQAEPADWILLATKAYDSAAACAWFGTAADHSTRLAVLQNGVDHVERLSRWFPAHRIVPVIVDCPVERIAPGRMRQRGPAVLKFPTGTTSESFAALFEGTGIACALTEDFVTASWWKLCLNAAGVINALTLQPARIAHDPHAAGLMRHIVEEAAAVGRAEGAQLGAGIADEVLGIYRNHPPDSVNSLHADRLAGRPMEIDLRNGIVVELGRRHGIATPFNQMAVELLRIA